MGKKRASSTQKAAALTKRAKVDPAVVEKCRSVRSALKGAVDLPHDAVEMLDGMLNESLMVPHDGRHPYQGEIVAMIAEVLGGIETRTRKTIADGEEEAGGVDQEKAKRAAATESAETSLHLKFEVVRVKKSVLADNCWAFRGTRAALQKAEEAQRIGDEELEAAGAKRAKLQAIIQDQFLPLKEHADGAPEPAQVVGQLRKQVQLDESLVTAALSSLSKAPAARGLFDKMAICELEEQFSKTVADYDVKISESGPAKASRSAAVASARAAHEAAKAQQMASADGFTDTQADERACEGALKAAQKAVKDLNTETRKAATALSNAKLRLDQFLEGPMAAFAGLRERVTPPPTVTELEPAAEDAEADAVTNMGGAGAELEKPAEVTVVSTP